MSQNERILPGSDELADAIELLKSGASSRWLVLDDAVVVAEMLKDGTSPHWRACHDFVTHLVYGMDVPVDLKDDIVQETMKVLPRALPHFHYKSRLTTWIIRIIYSKTASALRNYRRHNLNETPLDAPKEDEEGLNTFEIVMPRATEDECLIREELREAVTALSMYAERHKHTKRDREILRKVLLEDRTCEEVASALHINPQIVRRVIREARKSLRRTDK